MAGFTPDQATTMTAIALAESGGESGAHNSRGEDSRGLWQINAAAHPKLARRDLYDPLENAKAAFRVSGEGRDVSPWTTTHGGSDARYTAYRSEAQAAARASGDPAGGVWTGTPGYGHPLAAGGAGQGSSDALRTFLDSALAQSGDPYVWGAEARARDGDPDAFDCSELVQWAAQRAGVELPDGSWLQYLELDRQGATIPVEQALRTPGALLFSFSREPTAGGGRPGRAHVAISLGDGQTIEAQSPRSGVGSWRAGDRFQYAAVIPGISDGSAHPTAQLATAAATASTHDSDRDGVTDAMEARLGLSSTAADTDHDNVSDGYELLKLRTNPTLADTDRDRLLDSLELALGTDPLNPDSDRDGRVDGARNRPDGATDKDRDGVTDVLERILGSNPKNADSDRDGFVDGAEYRSSFDPTEAGSNPLADAQGGAGGRQRAVESPDSEQSWGLDDLGAH
jgi:cell wall-associated NlpC family hydrolase